MKKITELLKEYLKETIETKKGMKKRIYELEKSVKEARANEQYVIEQMNKYKQKLRKKQRRKRCINLK